MEEIRKKRSFEDHIQDLFLKDKLMCNQTLLAYPPPDGELYCPGMFDEWTCFNHTPAGATAKSPCPSHLVGIFNPEGYAYQFCTENGTWVTNNVNGHHVILSNYEECVNHSTPVALEEHGELAYVYVYIAGASLSLVLLVISLAIFIGFRQLRCDRVTIHTNLFISYLLTAIVWITYYKMVAMDGAVLIHNPIWCQILHVIAQCCTTTTFSWMFCEGLYMHMIIAHAMRTGKKLMKAIVIGGWTIPMTLGVVYGAVRGGLHRETKRCWLSDDNSHWITAGPVIVSVMVNFGILVNLVRLLMTKLRQIPDAAQNRKVAKATLILVPLFGLQYLLLPLRPVENTVFHDVYLFFVAIITSLQGSLTAIIFCFCNGEVHSVLRRKWQQHRLMTGHDRKNNGFTSSTFVDGYSVDMTRDMTMTTRMTYDTPHKDAQTPLMDKAEALQKSTSNGADSIQEDNTMV